MPSKRNIRRREMICSAEFGKMTLRRTLRSGWTRPDSERPKEPPGETQVSRKASHCKYMARTRLEMQVICTSAPRNRSCRLASSDEAAPVEHRRKAEMSETLIRHQVWLGWQHSHSTKSVRDLSRPALNQLSQYRCIAAISIGFSQSGVVENSSPKNALSYPVVNTKGTS